MENVKVNITKNGITTLATAGKYCPTNVDVVVAVPVGEVEQLAAQQAIEDSLVQGTVQQYANDRITQIKERGFQNVPLVSVSCPKASWAHLGAFFGCASLVQVDLPALRYAADSVFAYCTQLAAIDLPSLESIDIEAFRGCKNLSTLILRNTFVDLADEHVILLDTSAFLDTPIASGTGYVYVPDDLVEKYKAATNWSVYASQIRPISELEA